MKNDPIRDRQTKYVNQKELRHRLDIAYSKMYSSDSLLRESTRSSQNLIVQGGLSHLIRLSMHRLGSYGKPLIEIEEKFGEYKKPEIVELQQLFNANTERILDSIYDLKKTTDARHADIIEIDQSVSRRIDFLIEENEELRKLLNSRYSSKALFRISLAVTFGLIATLLAWVCFNVFIIHPLISVPMLIGSIGFSLLSFRRIKTNG